MAEYRITTWRRTFLDWRVEVYLGDELVHTGREYATRGGAIRSVKRAMRKAFAPPKTNPLREKTEWFHV